MSRRLKVLELIKRYKELKEEQAKIELLKTKNLIKKLREEKEKARKERTLIYQKMEKKKVMNVEEFLTYFNTTNFLRERENIFQREIEEQKEIAENWRNEVIKFHNEKRIVERIRDRVKQELAREEEKRFFKEMDELTVLKIRKSEV